MDSLNWRVTNVPSVLTRGRRVGTCDHCDRGALRMNCAVIACALCQLEALLRRRRLGKKEHRPAFHRAA